MDSRLWNKFQWFLNCRLQRQQLLDMDERVRKDLALSRVDVEQLAGRYGTSKKNDSKRSVSDERD